MYLPLDFVNYLITQPIWLGVSWTQYGKFAHRVSIKRKDKWRKGYGPWFNCKRDTNWKHQNPNSTNSRSTNYDIRHHFKPSCRETYKHWIFGSVLVYSTECLRTFSGIPRNGLWNWSGANMYLFLETPDSSPGRNTMFWLLILNGYWWLQ